MNGEELNKFKSTNSQPNFGFRISESSEVLINNLELSIIDTQDDVGSPICEVDGKNNFCKNLHKIKDIELVVKTFKDISAALEFAIKSDSLQKFISSKNVLLLNFDIEDSTKALTQLELNSLNGRYSNKSVILIFSSLKDENLMIFWKSNEVPHLFSLKPYSRLFSKDGKEMDEYIVNFLVKTLKNGHLGILNFILAHREIKMIELHFLADSRDYNLMLIAAEEGNDVIVKILLKLGFTSTSPHKNVNAQSLAYENRHFHVLLLLLQSNMTYPSNINIDECSDEIKEFYQASLSLHEAIIANNEEKVTEIIAQNSQLRHFYNQRNESAPKIALAHKQIDMYKLLISHDVHFSPHENTDSIMNKFEYSERRDLREFHNRHAKDLPEKHLNALMTSSVVGHDVSDVHKTPDLVMRAFKLLNDILLIKIILKIVTASRKLQMVFDFNRESVEVADPTVDSNTFGLFYLTGRIYIGALRLLNQATECETLGTIAHELCHYAMHLTFKNDAKPYRKNDIKTEEEFEKISQICKKNREKDEFVEAVYDEYPEERHHAELIVRVPHMLAFYSDNPDVLEDRRRTFRPLFDFYEQKIVPEMERALPDIEARAEKEIQEKDKKISKLIKTIIGLAISSIIVVGLLVLILYKPDINFKGLSDKEQEAIKNSMINYKNVKLTFRDLIPDNSEVYEKLSSDQLRSMLDKKVLNASDPHLKYLNDFIVHDWENLAKILKQKVLDSNLNFQNDTLKFENLFQKYPKTFQALTSNQINNIIDGIEISIGGKIENKTEFYIERSFLEEHRNNSYDAPSFDSSQIIEATEESKMFILSSEAGMGKTVTFEQLTIKIKRKFPMRWVSYIDLKKHTSFYNKNRKIGDVEDLLHLILQLESKTEFERRLFKEMYDSGDVVLLWNGFDEISPIYSEFIMSVLSYIQKHTKNVQYICTRPIYSNLLKERLSSSPYTLKGYEYWERHEFLHKYFALKKIGENETNNHINNVNVLLRSFDFRTWGNRGYYYTFETPLILKLYAEIVLDRETDDIVPAGDKIYDIYKIFIKRKVEIWASTSQGSQFSTKVVSSGLNMMEIYQKYALRSELVPLLGSSILLKLNNLQIMQRPLPKDVPLVEISRMGIMFISEDNAFEFSHKTFSEFFVAQYFVDNIYNADNNINEMEAELRLELFCNVVSLFYDKEQSITNFMKWFLNTQNNENDKNLSVTIGKLLKTKMRKYLIKFIDSKWGSFDFLISFFKNDPEVVKELMLIDQNETFCTAFLNPYNLGIFITEFCPNRSALNYLTDSEYDKLRLGNNQRGLFHYGSMFHSAYARYKRKVQFKSIPEGVGSVPSYRSYTPESALHNLISNLTKEEARELAVPFLSSKVSKIYEFGYVYFYGEYDIWKDFQDRLDSEDIKDIFGILFRDVFSFPVGDYSDKLLELLLEKSEEILNDTQIYEMFLENHILHYSIFNYDNGKKVFKLFVNHSTADQRKRVFLENYSEDTAYANPYFTVLHKTFINGRIKTVNYITKAYDRHFNLYEIRKILSSSSDFLNHLIYYADVEKCQIFVKYLKRIFGEDKRQLQIYLKQKISSTSLSIFEYFRNFPDDFSTKLKILKDLYDETVV